MAQIVGPDGKPATGPHARMHEIPMVDLTPHPQFIAGDNEVFCVHLVDAHDEGVTEFLVTSLIIDRQTGDLVFLDHADEEACPFTEGEAWCKMGKYSVPMRRRASWPMLRVTHDAYTHITVEPRQEWMGILDSTIDSFLAFAEPKMAEKLGEARELDMDECRVELVALWEGWKGHSASSEPSTVTSSKSAMGEGGEDAGAEPSSTS
ncbi:MAG: hypothetical protein GY838_13485 [bacterium]|nr:hypothetical protein [bacterium]